MKEKIKIGAIRWDAWVGDINNVGLEVEKCLSNPKYSNRLPFYTKINDERRVEIRCTNKIIIQKEIEYAKYANIDYFAFCWYPFNSGLDTARNLFLEVNKNKINWCIILGTNPFNEEDALWLIEQFNRNDYEKINNRPIVYIFNINDESAKIINFIRNNSKNYNPYFIGLVWNEEQAKKYTYMYTLDAVSQYCTPGQNNLKYDIISNKEEKKWQKYSLINNVVSWVTTGWDKRPRYENPVSWEDCSKFNNEYIKSPTLKQLQNHLKNALFFQASNYKNGMVLLYAWNEFDEGGFIAPTISKNNVINTEKLDVIKKTINKYKN